MATGAGKTAWQALLGVVASVSAALTAASAPGAFTEGTELFRLQDTQITESSGVVASSTGDRLFFTHNDSGDAARFFAIDDRGCTVARYTLAGVDHELFRVTGDVEDITRSRHRGEGVIWLADIGDNANRRADIAVWRVVEPRLPAPAAAASCPDPTETTVVATEYRLVYPDGPHDAETLLADPADGRLYVLTKSFFGESALYAAPLDLDPASSGRKNVMTAVTAVAVPASPVSGKDIADLVGRLAATGGDIAADRSAVVVRTYTDAWVWALGDRPLRDAFTAAPVKVPLSGERQGEAIAFTRDGTALITTCEDVNCPAHIYRRR